jgi:hypothetical protein
MPSKMATRARSMLAVMVVAASGCNLVTIDEYPCPPGGTTLTYESFGQSFMAAYCNRCHSAPEGQRSGAPADFVFDTLADVRAHKDRIFARAADTNDSMPTYPATVPGEQRVRLAEWLACGAP